MVSWLLMEALNTSYPSDLILRGIGLIVLPRGRKRYKGERIAFCALELWARKHVNSLILASYLDSLT